MASESSNIRVICRFRPINQREREEGEKSKIDASLDFPEENTIKVSSGGKETQTFVFDKVFHDPATTQQSIYSLAAKDTIEDVLKGYNGTIFAYGQTGSGKSFTMFGADITSPELQGIIPRSCAHIFAHIASDTEGTEFTIKCSFLEIYKEIIRDLLNPKGVNLRVRETPTRGVWVEDLSEHYCSNENDVLNLLKLGERYRAVSSTAMNAVSSRSHSLFILTLTQKSQDGSSKTGRLNLADLAGSEKIAKTGAVGETLEEAKKINQSLSSLGNCINALTKSKRGHVPYRDSKLTHVLRESLGGNCKTTLFIACSPHKFNIEETISTLKFGQRAKTIKALVTVNKQRSVAELNAIIQKLAKEMEGLKKYISVLETEISSARGPGFDLKSLKSKVIPEKAESATPSDVESDISDSTTEGVDEEDADSVPVPSLNLAEAQYELEKLRGESKAQIQELSEEISSLKENELEHKKETQELLEKLSLQQEQLNKEKSDKETEKAEFTNSLKKIEYQLKIATIEIETHLSNVKELTMTNRTLEQELSDARMLSEKLMSEMTELKLTKSTHSINDPLSADSVNTPSDEFSQQFRQRLETKVTENQKLFQENVSLKHEISKLNNASNSASKQLTEKDDRIAFLERRLVELTERNGLLLHALDESTKSASDKEKKYQEQIETMQEMGRINDFHKSRIVQPVQTSVKDTFISLFTPRVNSPKRMSVAQQTEKEGWLIKQGGVIKSWQKRWFILQGSFLYYFKDKGSTDSKGTIELDGCQVLAVDFSQVQKPFGFAIYHPNKRTFFMCASSQEELDEWIFVLQRKLSNKP